MKKGILKAMKWVRKKKKLFKEWPNSRISSYHSKRHAVFVQALCIHQYKMRPQKNTNFSTLNILSCLTCLVQNSETAPVECSCDILFKHSVITAIFCKSIFSFYSSRTSLNSVNLEAQSGDCYTSKMTYTSICNTSIQKLILDLLLWG